MNAGVLASSSSGASSYTSSTAATLAMTDATILTSSSGSNGAFAFGAKATVTLDHVTITTTKASSRGVDATYGGTVTITNSKITTAGDHCAALATDRYQGTSAPQIHATNVYGITAGSGSPGIYCTGTFDADHVTLSATGSEAAAIEGKNSIALTDSVIAGASKWGVMIYQSNSGDSSTGKGAFSMTNGSLTNNYSGGPMFFVTNTTASIDLNNVTLTKASSADALLVAGAVANVTSTACGIASSNVNSSWTGMGAVVTFGATYQTLVGDIRICDASSSLALTMASSTLTGKINTANITTGGIALTLDACSTWTLTGNSHVTSVTGAGTIYTKGYSLSGTVGSGINVVTTS
jgi:hypothetical protein